MKQSITKILITLIICMMSTDAFGYYYDIVVENADGVSIYYKYINGGTELEVSEGDKQYADEVNIPEEITFENKTLKVTAIGERAFFGCNLLSSVTIPSSVTSIGHSAFRDCHNLISVTIPQSVTSIGNFVFEFCSGLSSIIVEEGNTIYDSRNNCNAIIETASKELKYGCTNTIIPDDVTSIGIAAFSGATNLASMTIPDGVTSIRENAFANCTALNAITIGNGVTVIGDFAFNQCNALSSLTIGNNVTTIGHFAFSGCNNLTSVTIPNSVTSLCNGVFAACTCLTSVILSNSVISIGEGAFNQCSSLQSLTIPKSVEFIGSNAFVGCSGLTSIIVEDGNPTYDSREKCNALIETASNTLITGCMNTTIPDGIISIGDGAFSKCSGLTSVTIPNTITSIGNWAFYDCKLISLSIPASVTSIGEGAFGGICYPESVVSLIEEPFEIYGETEASSTFAYYTFHSSTLYVPAGSVDKYRATKGWKDFVNIETNDFISVENADDVTLYYRYNNDEKDLTLVPGETRYEGDINIPKEVTYEGETLRVTAIGANAFKNCILLTSVTIPESVVSIGSNAFEGCEGLTTMTIPNSVINIGEWAFYNCRNLLSVNIPSGVTSISDGTFCNCEGLTSLTIPNNVTAIGSGTFSNCTSLTSLAIPESVTSIGSSAFSNCSGLTSIEIPSGVTTIESGTFSKCTGLTSLTIPDGVTSIGDFAFRECSGLTTITIPKGVTSIGMYAFDEISFQSVVSLIEKPFDINGEYALRTFSFETFEYATLYVPDGTINKYKETLGWKDFKNINGQEYSIAAENADGVMIYYNFINDKSELMVISVGKQYEGDVIIPEEVAYKDKTLKVTAIADEAFNGCKSLYSVYIPNSVISIGDYAFYYCSSLTTLHIGSSVTSIGKFAFYGCTALTSISVEDGNMTYDSRDNCNALIETASNTLLIGCKNTTIPNSVTTLGYAAFSECEGLNTITIPDGVTTISDWVFYNCAGLTSITIPNSVSSIGAGAFFGVELESVISQIEEPFDIYGEFDPVSTFSSRTYHRATLYVPKGTIEKYKVKEGWKEFELIEEMGGSGISNIEAQASDAPYYNLNGQRIAQPKKGIYIQNGKKLVIK